MRDLSGSVPARRTRPGSERVTLQPARLPCMALPRVSSIIASRSAMIEMPDRTPSANAARAVTVGLSSLTDDQSSVPAFRTQKAP